MQLVVCQPPLQAVAAPQELHAGILKVNAHCTRVLEAKDGTLAAAHALLACRDDQYARLLQIQVMAIRKMVWEAGEHVAVLSCCCTQRMWCFVNCRCCPASAERGDGCADCHHARGGGAVLSRAGGGAGGGGGGVPAGACGGAGQRWQLGCLVGAMLVRMCGGGRAAQRSTLSGRFGPCGCVTDPDCPFVHPLLLAAGACRANGGT